MSIASIPSAKHVTMISQACKRTCPHIATFRHNLSAYRFINGNQSHQLSRLSTMSIPTTQKAIIITGHSAGYDVIKYTDVPTPQIESTEVLVKNRYAGVNFVDGLARKGIMPTPVPYILGRGATGTVAAVGDQVTKYKVGDNVSFSEPQSYAQFVKFDQSKVQVAKLRPDLKGEEFERYASLLQGLTAVAFTTLAHKVEAGQTILVWAAAGGVGQFVVQLAHEKGAKVIAIASTQKKLDVAKSQGADFTVLASDDVAAKVAEFTGGEGVDAVYDSVGRESFETSLKSTKKGGSFLLFGYALGPVPNDAEAQAEAQGVKLTRPALPQYTGSQQVWDSLTLELIQLLDEGKVKYDSTTVYDLKDYAQAAQDLEGRKTTGNLLLRIPQ